MRAPTRRAVLGGALAAALCPGVAAARAVDKIKAEGVVRIAVYRDFEPWSWAGPDGRFTGIDVDLGQVIAKALGARAQIVDFMADEDVGDDLRNMVWRGSLVGGTLADIMMHVPVDRQLALANDRAVIAAPYYREGFLIACGPDTDCEVAPPAFKGKRLVAELDSIPDFYFSGGFGGVLRADTRHLPSGAAAVAAVAGGDADVVVATRAQIEHAKAAAGDTLKVRHGPIPAMPSAGWDVGLAVKDDSRDLADALDAIMARFRKDGTIDTILARYGVTPHPPLAS
ncbi:substrate-binding periplasmic protein [Sphingomonas sp.]|uniref:substrate-binding periplasmic protein n=1 Tax=Sphingomonas sp. TaxID=28214 RepID=UPI0035C79D51